MFFEIESSYLVLAFAAGSVILFAEAIYLLCFSTTSYRTSINRRLKLLKDQPDRESVLIQLRRERGLTGTGLYGTPVLSFNRLVLQSGVTIGLQRLMFVVAVGVIAVFVGVWVFRGDLVEAVFITIIAAALLPYLALRLLRARRHGKFGARFPDAIDIIVARELPDPVGTEFGIVADEITYGADLETAMRNLAFRVGQEDLPLFVTAVAIQGSTGGNLSEILENLSSVIRLRFKMRRKIKALAAEGKFSALFLSALPIGIFFMIRLVAPEFYGSVWHEQTTKIGLATAGTWMLIGNFIMYRLVNFRI